LREILPNPKIKFSFFLVNAKVRESSHHSFSLQSPWKERTGKSNRALKEFSFGV
jgi:hypothetical protein